jgi:hypothetical protein
LDGPGAIEYQAFKATYMACNASHLNHRVHLNFELLRGNLDHDPAEFVAEEDLLQCRSSKESEGDGETGETTLFDDAATVKTSNTTAFKQCQQQ